MLTILMSSLMLSCRISCFTSFTASVFLLLQTLWKRQVLLHSAHFFPYYGHCLGGCMLPQYLHICFEGVLDCDDLLGLTLSADLDIIILSNPFDPKIVFIRATCALCVYTVFAQDRIPSLVMVSLLIIVVSSLIIITSISLSLRP